MTVLPGQPLDGSGRVCIHLFVPDKNGPFVEPHALHQTTDEEGKPTRELVAKKTRGRLACNSKKSVAPVTKNGITTVTHRSDDPRAVTCPKCMESEYYIKIMSDNNQTTVKE